MRMPKSVPLRHMVASTVQYGMSKIGSSVHLQAGMEMLRNVWLLPLRKLKAAIFFSSGMSSAMMGATSSRMSSDVPALVAVVRLVAHLQQLGDEHLDVDLALELHRVAQHGIEVRLQPAQAGEHLVVARAKAQHLAQALIERAVRAVAEGLVLHDPHGHGGRDHARHRADGAVHVARVEFDLAGGGQLLGLLEVLGQPLVDQAAHDGALLRAAHALPRDRRAGVQDGLFVHAGDDLARDAQPHERRLRGEDAAQRLLIGGVDLLKQLGLFQLAQICGSDLVAACDGLPVHMHGRLLLAHEILIEGLDAEVDHVQLLGK